MATIAFLGTGLLGAALAESALGRLAVFGGDPAPMQ